MIIFWILLGILILAIGGMIPMLVKTVPIARRVYRTQLVRETPDKWGRVCSAPENEEQLAMWNDGCAWAEARSAEMQEVAIENDGLKLYGEFYRFSEGKRCVLILPGRCECLKYSYYFAAPYERAGLNVLVIDTRAHGKSDGKFNTLGRAESGDVKAWARFLEQELGQQEIYLHTICIGTASAIYAMAAEDCPASIKGLITEGCFITFRETFKRHMMADHRPLFPVLDLVMLEIWRVAGTNQWKYAPIRYMKKLNQRVLFLYGEKDIFSIPEKSKKLFAACGSSDKKLVWFEKGGHSHLRINNKEQYDQAIVDFLNE